jgi:ComF family protein
MVMIDRNRYPVLVPEETCRNRLPVREFGKNVLPGELLRYTLFYEEPGVKSRRDNSSFPETSEASLKDDTPWRTILRHRVFELRDALIEVAFPLLCAFCGGDREVDPDWMLCPECAESLKPISPPFCDICGRPFGSPTGEHLRTCGACLSRPPAYLRARFAVEYEEPVKTAITRFKYGKVFDSVRPFSLLLARAFRDHFSDRGIDLIVPVPMHRKSLIRRGFNQALVPAARLSRRLGIPLDRSSFIKTRDTSPQAGLTRKQRIVNLRGSFGIARADRIAGRRVLLVDDVSTTGSTLREAARTLVKKGEADRVDVLVLALRLPSGAESAPRPELGA